MLHLDGTWLAFFYNSTQARYTILMANAHRHSPSWVLKASLALQAGSNWLSTMSSLSSGDNTLNDFDKVAVTTPRADTMFFEFEDTEEPAVRRRQYDTAIAQCEKSLKLYDVRVSNCMHQARQE